MRSASFRLIGAFALLPIFCLLGACGFRPVYGNRGGVDQAAAVELNQVAIENVPDRMGQQIRNALIDRMYGQGRPSQPKYRLTLVMKPLEEDLGIQADETSTRSLLNMYVEYTMRDAATNKMILHGTAHSISSFNTLNDQYGNLAAKEGAVERTIDEDAEQIVNRLSLYFGERDEAPPPSADETQDDGDVPKSFDSPSVGINPATGMPYTFSTH